MSDYLTDREIEEKIEKLLTKLIGEVHKLYSIELEFDKAITIKDRINETVIEMKRERLVNVLVRR